MSRNDVHEYRAIVEELTGQVTAASADLVRSLRVGPFVLVAAEHQGPLSDSRLVVKDVIDVAGQRTGAGNPTFLEDAPIAPVSAPAVERLISAGATVIGKAHTDELAFSLNGTNVHYGTPLNSRAPDHVPGGSSSGPAAAVAGAIADVALATDTGGSIRIPSSYCGIFGFRPTHGRVPTAGVVPLAPSFDTVGLMAANGLTLRIAGEALLQSTCPAFGDLDALVVADDLVELADDTVAHEVVRVATSLARHLGIVTRHLRVSDDRTSEWVKIFQQRQLSEAWENHGPWIESRRPQFGPGIEARFARAAASGRPGPYEEFLANRASVQATVFRNVPSREVIVVPSAIATAPRLDKSKLVNDSLRERTLALTCVAGLGGLPAISIPLGEINGLPVGFGLIARPGDDELLLSIAAAVESVAMHLPSRP